MYVRQNPFFYQKYCIGKIKHFGFPKFSELTEFVWKKVTNIINSFLILLGKVILVSIPETEKNECQRGLSSINIFNNILSDNSIRPS